MNARDPHTAAMARYVGPLTARIAPILSGLPVEVQAAVLADLTAVYLAGLHPSLREKLLTMHIEAVRKLTEINIKAAVGEGILPPEWERATSQ